VAGLRDVSAKALAVAGNVALQTSGKIASRNGQPNLQGDRIVEWSFVVARLRDGPAVTLDFGADTAFLSLAAAQRGHHVVALDRLPDPRDFRHERVEYVQADILDRPLGDRRFDQIVNCSSIEHVGLAGRYGSGERPDGDLEAMAILRNLLADGGTMILTIPVGRDLVCAPAHRIYGNERLPRLLDGYNVDEAQFWHKDAGLWQQTDSESALATEGSIAFYSLGLFVVSHG
jgi:hypothetical protein